MGYKVVVSIDAKEDLHTHAQYLLYEKLNPQAAHNVLADFKTTKDKLKNIANSLKLCENPQLRQLGFRKINFTKHNYFILYRIIDDTVFIDAVYHNLQDYESKIK